MKKQNIEVGGKTFTVAQAIDHLGSIKQKRAALEEAEKEFVKELKTVAEPGTKLYGKYFSLQAVSSARRTIDTVKAFKKLGKEKFLKVASVSLTAAKKVMSDEDIDKVATMGKETISIRTEQIPRAQDMGAPAAFEEIDVG